jgi:hypothetical protein
MSHDGDNILSDPAWHGALLWHGVDAYRHLAVMEENTAQNISKQISDALSTNELMFMRGSGGRFATLVLPVLGERTGPYCIAFASAYLVWGQRKAFGDDWYNPGSPLLDIADEAFGMWRALYPEEASELQNAKPAGKVGDWSALTTAFERVYANTWGRSAQDLPTSSE